MYDWLPLTTYLSKMPPRGDKGEFPPESERAKESEGQERRGEKESKERGKERKKERKKARKIAGWKESAKAKYS